MIDKNMYCSRCYELNVEAERLGLTERIKCSNCGPQIVPIYIMGSADSIKFLNDCETQPIQTISIRPNYVEGKEHCKECFKTTLEYNKMTPDNKDIIKCVECAKPNYGHCYDCVYFNEISICKTCNNVMYRNGKYCSNMLSTHYNSRSFNLEKGCHNFEHINKLSKSHSGLEYYICSTCGNEMIDISYLDDYEEEYCEVANWCHKCGTLRKCCSDCGYMRDNKPELFKGGEKE